MGMVKNIHLEKGGLVQPFQFICKTCLDFCKQIQTQLKLFFFFQNLRMFLTRALLLDPLRCYLNLQELTFFMLIDVTPSTPRYIFIYKSYMKMRN